MKKSREHRLRIIGICLVLGWLIGSSIPLLAQGPLIYGYLSNFPSQSTALSSSEVAWMNQYHINYVQFYDWQWKHHVPLAGTVQNPAASWQDLSGRTNYRQTILDMINACHNYGMKAMNYNLLYGALAGYGQDGSEVNYQWGLWDTSAGCNGSQWSVSAFSTIYMFNPADTGWQNYLFNRENDVFTAYPFDGWQVDQLGDPGSLKYDCSGASVDVWTTFVGFLNNAKYVFGNKSIIFNNVGTYGMFGVCNQTADDAVYVECWEPGQTTYNDLKSVIDDGLAWGNGKPVVLAAYMDRGKTSGSFNPPGVLLCDAAIFASGGTHIELGDGGHMLCSEYFPNQTLTLSADLANTLTNYYNFILSYQPWLYGGLTNSANAISMSIASANNATAKKVWAFAKAGNGKHMLNLINLIGENSINWRDNTGTYPAPTAQTNFNVKYYYGSTTPNSVQLASPDTNGGAATALNFSLGVDASGNFVSFTVPSLNYWDMVMMPTGLPASAPEAPIALAATGGNLQISLSWTASPSAASYNVYRSASSGGPYTLVATGVIPSSYTDVGLSGSTTYYYVVTGVNSVGESVYSNEASAAPNPWATQDIGAVGVSGSATYYGGTYTVTGSGADIESTSDAFRYVDQSSWGNCSVVARVVTQQNTDPWAKAGVMIRETTAAGSRHASVFITPNNRVEFQWRSSTGGGTSATVISGVNAPQWVKITRTSNSFSAYYSADGVSWVQIGAGKSISMASNATIGLAVTSHNNSVTSTATMDNVTATP